jgi:hypothetical protein
MTRKTALILGCVAIAGGLLAVMADWYSAWTGRFEMDTAFSVALADVRQMLASKSPTDMVVGSYLGQFCIPLHGVGLYLAYLATRPASRLLSIVVFLVGLYTIAVGTSVHASLVYVASVARTGDGPGIDAVAGFFDVTAYSMVALILLISAGLSVLILSGRSLYPRWTFLVSPMALMLISTALLFLLPDGARDLREFLAVSGFNFPLMVFHVVTTGVIAGVGSEAGSRSILA